ncbi:hypothetical protein Tco_1064551 [Tanacetum coccineum]
MVKRKKPSLRLGRNWVNTYAIRNTKLLSGIQDSHHGPSDAMYNPPQPLKDSQKTLISFLTEITHISIDFISPNVPVMRMASVAAKPYQGDSSEFYLITCSIYTDQRGIVVFPMVDADQEKYEHVSLKVTSTQDGKISQDDDSRLYLVDDLKEVQVHIEVKLKGTSSGLKSKDRYAYHKLKEKIQDHEQRLKTFIEYFISKTIQVCIVIIQHNMSTSNQQTLADSGVNERPLMLEKGNYIPWESRFRRFLDNKLEEGD